MFKKDWIVFSTLAAFTVALTVFAVAYKPNGAQVAWLAYVSAVAIIATIAYLIYLLYATARQGFDRLLKHENFNTEKLHVWKERQLHIDFTNKLVANNYLSTKPIFSFGDLVGYRFETYRISGDTYAEHLEVLSDNEQFVSIVLTVKMPDREFEYLYIPMYEVKVSADDVGDTLDNIPNELLEKYPDLQQIVNLQNDIETILSSNKTASAKK